MASGPSSWGASTSSLQDPRWRTPTTICGATWGTRLVICRTAARTSLEQFTACKGRSAAFQSDGGAKDCGSLRLSCFAAASSSKEGLVMPSPLATFASPSCKRIFQAPQFTHPRKTGFKFGFTVASDRAQIWWILLAKLQQRFTGVQIGSKLESF